MTLHAERRTALDAHAVRLADVYGLWMHSAKWIVCDAHMEQTEAGKYNSIMDSSFPETLNKSTAK